MEKKKDRKFIIYIVIVIFIASLGTFAYRVGSYVKGKIDYAKQETNKIKQEMEEKERQAEEETKKRKEELEQKRKEAELENEINSFNNMLEFYIGTRTGTMVKYEIDEVVESNKKNTEHPIEVIFDGTSYGTDPDKIKEIKDSLKDLNGHDFQYYEISADYDENGYINKIAIETK